MGSPIDLTSLKRETGRFLLPASMVPLTLIREQPRLEGALTDRQVQLLVGKESLEEILSWQFVD